VKALFQDKLLGNFTGKQLQEGGISLTLPKIAQEMLEIQIH